MRRSTVAMWMGAVTLSALAACGDSGKGGDATKAPDGDATTGDAGDGGDTGDAIVLPTDCYLPAAPLATMDCDLMCRKVAACGAAEADCLTECAELTYLLNPDAAARVESCFVDLPCNGGPAVFGAVGCIARLADDATYHAPSADSEGCAALETKVESCALAEEVSDAVKFQCDKYAIGLGGDIMDRAAACADRPCDEVATCIAASSCAWKDLPTGSTTNPPGHDECSDETSAIVSGGAYLLSLSCGQSCTDKASDCAQGCMVDGTDLSAACSDCFGALGVCAHDHCASPCATGTDAGCYACLTSAGCEAPFVECAGLPVPGSPADTTCTAADRTAIAASGDITESVGQCVDQCQDGRSCADDCMTVVLDASDRCGATCGGALAVCAATSCHAQCDGTATLGACYACLDASACDDAFTTCSGGVAIEPPAGAVCLGVGDQTQADDGTAWDATATCAAGCVGKAASCIADCVAATQLSDACQPCYAALGTCENDKCASACAGDHAGPECAACLDDQGCVTAFQTCGGRAPYPPVTLGTDTCGAALDCAVACAGSGPATDACVEACVVAAEPGLIPLARRTVECVRDTCKGQDVSCIAISCLADYQTCRAITPELGCQGIDGCLAACGDDAGCQLACFTKAQGADAVSDFLAIDECARRFCDPTDSATFVPCRSRALAEPAECQNVVHQCADPDFVPEPLACYLLATCINNCPDQPCRDACVAQSSEVAVEDANTFFACVSEQCPSGEPLCVYDKCFSEYHHCYGQEGIAFSCGQIFQCQALDVCDTQSCQESCIGSAADSASAVAFQTVYACFIDQCLGPNGFVPGCIDQVQQPGGACETAVQNCP